MQSRECRGVRNPSGPTLGPCCALTFGAASHVYGVTVTEILFGSIKRDAGAVAGRIGSFVGIGVGIVQASSATPLRWFSQFYSVTVTVIVFDLTTPSEGWFKAGRDN
jgi:hypothetical protein